MKCWFDLETQDPDDILALAILATHPACELIGVSITPGCHNQVGLVRSVLGAVGRAELPIGGKLLDHHKNCVAQFYYKHFHDIRPREPDGEAETMLTQAIQLHPDLTVITGAAVTHLAQALKTLPPGALSRWVGQGGFAGDNVVPEANRLPKFAGKVTCPTFNFNANPKAAQAVLSSPAVSKRLLVSKNVCHGVVYDRTLHDWLAPHLERYAGLKFMHWLMERYLKDHPEGKLFHDPLAVCCAIDPDVCIFAEVELRQQSGGWGSRLWRNTHTWISISHDHARMLEVLRG